MGARILLVDDDRDLLKVFKEGLSARGFEVFLAASGEEFQREAPLRKPDLIVLDIMLGNENSMRVYEELLFRGFDSSVPVIFLSGLVEDRPPSPAQPGRTYALYGKPIRLSCLAQEIHRLLGGVSR